MKILVFGLPGSGKTTLSLELQKITGWEHLNADQVRKQFDDWDFSPEGRKRQMNRMRDLSSDSSKNFIVDFVCPTEALRKEFDADFEIWINTIEKGRFEDTNKLFENPFCPDVEVTSQDCEVWARRIKKYIVSGEKTRNVSWIDTYPTVQQLGRWQPWHPGHRKLFDEAFLRTGQVCIQIRNMTPTESNPFNFQTVRENIIEDLQNRYIFNEDYKIMSVPNITKIVWGRGVGYEFEQIDLGETIHKISATDIRKTMKEDGKL